MKLIKIKMSAFYLVIPIFLGCSTNQILKMSGIENIGNGYNIGWIRNEAADGTTTIEYTPKSILLEKEFIKAKNEMREPDTSKYTNGGMVVVEIRRSTIGSANTDNFEFVLLNDSKEVIKRQLGKDRIPEVPTSHSEYGNSGWWNIEIIRIDEEIKTKIYLYVIDKLSNSRDEYEISNPIQK